MAGAASAMLPPLGLHCAEIEPPRLTLALLDQHGAEVVDVGESWPGHEQIADGIEEGPRVVVGEHGLGVDAGLRCALQSIGINQRPGIVLAAVDTIGVSCQRIDTLYAI